MQMREEGEWPSLSVAQHACQHACQQHTCTPPQTLVQRIVCRIQLPYHRQWSQLDRVFVTPGTGRRANTTICADCGVAITVPNTDACTVDAFRS